MRILTCKKTWNRDDRHGFGVGSVTIRTNRTLIGLIRLICTDFSDQVNQSHQSNQCSILREVASMKRICIGIVLVCLLLSAVAWAQSSANYNLVGSNLNSGAA